MALGGLRDHGVGQVQNRLGRAVVALQRQQPGRLGELRAKVQDVAHRRAAKAVNALGVVAHHGQALAAGLEAPQDRGLEPVGVLVLVNQHMVKACADFRPQFRVAHQLAPEQQQIVVVHNVLLLLGLDVGREQSAQFAFPLRAPWKRLLQHAR